MDKETQLKIRGDMYRQRALALRRQASVYRKMSRTSKVVAIQTVVAFTDVIISLQNKITVWRSLFWMAFLSMMLALLGLLSYATR